MARERGIRVTDLLALAPQNDPYYAGHRRQWNAARWFVDLWQAIRLYQRRPLAARALPACKPSQCTKPNGKPTRTPKGLELSL